ncbi:MAG TPA: DUF1566 domain-containing protein [Saprospiraceae bacterium]|mgnify:CR=1 FL=1|nr:DUF1566 domain-containing protein [Saprospiraceae bacterium]
MQFNFYCRKYIIFLFVVFVHQLQSQSIKKVLDKLPDTGQSKSYTDTLGEDSDYTINAPELIDNLDGTITDKITGLMWQKADGGEMTHSSALQYADSLTLGSFTDWRLPIAFEIYSIQNLQVNNPALNTTYFTKSNAEYWWTSDLQVNDNSRVWVSNAGGGIGNHLKSETISAGGTKRYHARAVRNIKENISLQKRFEVIDDDVVVDSLTGLMWQRKISNNPMTWENALAFSEQLSHGNYNDWRLPNIKELHSIHMVKEFMPCLDRIAFPLADIRKLWSSTTQNNQATRAWYFDTNFGITTQEAKSTALYVLCVRSTSIVNANTVLQSEKIKYKIYPNPTSNTVSILIKEPLQIMVSDVAGKIYITKYLTEENNSIDLSTAPNGILFLKFPDGQKYKLVKE